MLSTIKCVPIVNSFVKYSVFKFVEFRKVTASKSIRSEKEATKWLIGLGIEESDGLVLGNIKF